MYNIGRSFCALSPRIQSPLTFIADPRRARVTFLLHTITGKYFARVPASNMLRVGPLARIHGDTAEHKLVKPRGFLHSTRVATVGAGVAGRDGSGHGAPNDRNGTPSSYFFEKHGGEDGRNPLQAVPEPARAKPVQELVEPVPVRKTGVVS